MGWDAPAVGGELKDGYELMVADENRWVLGAAALCVQLVMQAAAAEAICEHLAADFCIALSAALTPPMTPKGHCEAQQLITDCIWLHEHADLQHPRQMLLSTWHTNCHCAMHKSRR